MKRTHSISIFFAKKIVSPHSITETSTNMFSVIDSVENISMNVNKDSQLSETEQSFFDTTNKDELITPTSTDFLDQLILNNTSDCLINETEQQAQAVVNWPVVWSANMWKDKKEDYPWLTCSNGYLGCEICKKVSSLSVYKHQGLSISTEWSLGNVTYSGHDQDTKLRHCERRFGSIRIRLHIFHQQRYLSKQNARQ